MTEYCHRERVAKDYLTEISCDSGGTCCYLTRVFTYTDSFTLGLRTCLDAWNNCSPVQGAVSSEGLSDLEKIWLLVICILLAIVLIVIVYFILRIRRQKYKQYPDYETKGTVTDSPASMVIQVESAPPPKPVESAAAVFAITNATRRPTTRERTPPDLAAKLDHLLKGRDEKKLSALLETINESNQVGSDKVDYAQGVLEAWRLESELQGFCNRSDMCGDDISAFKHCVERADDAVQRERIHPMVLKHSHQRLKSELAKQAVISELRFRLASAIQSDSYEDLETVVETIRAKQFDNVFEKELESARIQFVKLSQLDRSAVESELTSAVSARDPTALRRAIQRAERSTFVEELGGQISVAKRTMDELEEIQQLQNLHRLKISTAIKSGEIKKMELALSNVKMDGCGEDLKIEIGDLETALKRRYLQKRLKGNLNVAIQNLDLIKLRRAINEVTASGFLKELGIELDQAQGLLSKLERLDLIKKAVMDLTNNNIAEIKSYTAPPIQVHKVLMALLIVLGEEPEVVRDWFEIQVILVKTGRYSLKRRVQDYNHANLSIGNARRAATIINDLSPEELNTISKAAKVFYLWTSAVVEDRLSLDIIK